jgi:mono/diheme cytochrome c family protein
VLSRHCADCHGKNGTRKGGRQFFDRSGQTLEADAVALSAMRDAILAGTMPPQGRKPLTLREFASINELVNQQERACCQHHQPKEEDSMSIDAIVKTVVHNEDGSGRLELVPRNDCVAPAGQKVLSFDSAPHDVP